MTTLANPLALCSSRLFGACRDGASLACTPRGTSSLDRREARKAAVSAKLGESISPCSSRGKPSARRSTGPLGQLSAPSDVVPRPTWCGLPEVVPWLPDLIGRRPRTNSTFPLQHSSGLPPSMARPPYLCSLPDRRRSAIHRDRRSICPSLTASGSLRTVTTVIAASRHKAR